jgi:hypothetical protein
MKSRALLALAGAACLSLSAAAADNPFEALKGKVKPGMYSYEMSMDMGAMPGMPPGMGRQNHTFQHCVTPEDINRGEMGKGGRGMPENCEIKDFKSSGNAVDYTMACKPSADRKGPPGGMQAHNHMTFNNNGYVMDMEMDAGGPGGQPMHMKQHMVAKYLGPECSGK